MTADRINEQANQITWLVELRLATPGVGGVLAAGIIFIFALLSLWQSYV